MKHGVKPNAKQSKLLEKHNFDRKDWLVIKNTAEGVTFCHRETKKLITLS